MLRTHFKLHGITEFSLRDMMDFLLPAIENPGCRYELTPAYRVKYFAQILYDNVIKAVSVVDCGETFRMEWEGRKDRLRKYLKASGGLFPYILHGRSPALSASLATP